MSPISIVLLGLLLYSADALSGACNSTVCQNSGTCTQTTPTSFTCSCASGYIGDYCNDDKCTDQNLLNRALTVAAPLCGCPNNVFACQSHVCEFSGQCLVVVRDILSCDGFCSSTAQGFITEVSNILRACPSSGSSGSNEPVVSNGGVSAVVIGGAVAASVITLGLLTFLCIRWTRRRRALYQHSLMIQRDQMTDDLQLDSSTPVHAGAPGTTSELAVMPITASSASGANSKSNNSSSSNGGGGMHVPIAPSLTNDSSDRPAKTGGDSRRASTGDIADDVRPADLQDVGLR